MDIDMVELEMARESGLELQFWGQCRTQWRDDDLMPEWQLEINGHKVDFVFLDCRLMIEIMGGVTDGRSRGDHVRRKGYIRDRRYAIWAQMNGWAIFELTDEQLNDETGILSVALYRDAYQEKTRRKPGENTCHYIQ